MISAILSEVTRVSRGAFFALAEMEVALSPTDVGAPAAMEAHGPLSESAAEDKHVVYFCRAPGCRNFYCSKGVVRAPRRARTARSG